MKKKVRRWSEQDIQILKDLYDNKTIKYICSRLKRSKTSVFIMANKLNLKRLKFTDNIKEWTDQEKQYLREYYPTDSLENISLVVGHSIDSIRRMAAKLNIYRTTDAIRENHKLWSLEDQQYLIVHYATDDIKKIANILNRSLRSITKKAQDLNLKKDITTRVYNRGWISEEEQYLINNYTFGDLQMVAKTLDRTKKAINERAKLLDLKRDYNIKRFQSHKYTINEHFFKTWSDDMAYILGFIWSDGNMGRDDYAISITQHKKDKYILENILSVLGSNKKLIDGHKTTCCLSINNKIIYNDLKGLGLVPKKSKVIKMPQNLPPEFIPAFIRGAMDGDGSVSKSRYAMKISTASKDFADGLCEALDTINIDYRLYNEPYICNDMLTDFYQVKVLRKQSLKKLYHLMYDCNPSLYLVRKKQRFINMGIEDTDFAVKNKHIMRKIIQQNILTGEIDFHDQIKPLKKSGFSQIHSALKSGKSYKGYTFRYAD